MRISHQRMTCECGHVFDGELVTDAPVAVVAASMEAVRCPKCGSSKIFLGGSYDDAPPLTASVPDRARWWRERGDLSISSLTIWCAHMGLSQSKYSGLSDFDDFQRCKRLLELIPEWRADLGKVVERFEWFKPFADRWAEFEALYSEGSLNKSAPKLYEAMRIASCESEALRESVPPLTTETPEQDSSPINKKEP